MRLTSENFNQVKIGTVLVKDPCYEDNTEYVVTKVTKNFICYQYDNKRMGTVKARFSISTKWMKNKNSVWVTKWHIKDAEWESEWNKYFEGCGTEAWYYAHCSD